MSVHVTYVCDVSGVSSSDLTQFIRIKIHSETHKLKQNATAYSAAVYEVPYGGLTVTKLIHKDVATKLNLLPNVKEEDKQPEMTFESKLQVLLKEYIDDAVYESVENGLANARNG